MEDIVDGKQSPLWRAVRDITTPRFTPGDDNSSILKRTGSIDKKIVDHAIEIENKHSDTNIKTCCNRTSDSRLLKFIATFSITSIIIIFSCYQLSKPDISCPDQNTYVGLITLLIGIWLKSPMS